MRIRRKKRMTEYIDKHEAYTLLKDLEAAYIYMPVKEAYGKAARHIDQIKTADVQPVTRGRWITKAEEYYKAWQDSGRSWDDMPYFVTGLKFACSNCFEQFDVNAEGVEKWNGCPLCLARMDGDTNG
jgi:hypothetical protein